MLVYFFLSFLHFAFLFPLSSIYYIYVSRFLLYIIPLSLCFWFFLLPSFTLFLTFCLLDLIHLLMCFMSFSFLSRCHVCFFSSFFPSFRVLCLPFTLQLFIYCSTLWLFSCPRSNKMVVLMEKDVRITVYLWVPHSEEGNQEVEISQIHNRGSESTSFITVFTVCRI